MQYLLHVDFLKRCSFVILLGLAIACNDTKKPPEKDVVKEPEQLEIRTKENLEKIFNYAVENQGKINDSTRLVEVPLLKTVYKENEFQTIWSLEDNWKPAADSLYETVQHAAEYGLFPEDYHFSTFKDIRQKLREDTNSRRDAALWARADLLYSEAFFLLARHLKLGRLERDSITLRQDSLYSPEFFIGQFHSAVANNSIIRTLQSLEPVYPGYQEIRAAIPEFLRNADFRKYTYILYPYKDTALFKQSLEKRLMEEGLLQLPLQPGDTVSVKTAISSYQESKEMKVTGKLTESVVRSLNNTDEQKFKNIAVTLDNYKLMPDTVPSTYIFVNLPAYKMYVYQEDTLAFTSRVIIGAPSTRTPLLNSKVSNFITYPQWTVPYSIIFRDMLPKIRKNIDYLNRQNLMVVDRDDVVVDPASIDWEKMNPKHFPYLIRQREGDDNSLGIIKFNFVNKYDVYLHDTNARSLFSRSNRALSHGCVRVKEWQQLSRFLTSPDTLRFPPDTLNAWMMRQEKHKVTGFPRVPLFIRYFTVEAEEGTLKFYNDVYGYDRKLREKYFMRKEVS